MVAAAVAGAAVVGGVYSANQQSKAANSASAAQQNAANDGIAEQRRQFDATQALLAPYVQGGQNAFGQQQTLAGLNGNAAQASAISALQQSPQYLAAMQSGNSNILANASATGGLRGGNVQGALGQFGMQLTAQTINDHYNQLAGLSQQGLGAATQTGAFGAASSNNVTNLLGQVGSAQAGNALAQGNAQAGYGNAILSGIGAYGGLGGFNIAPPIVNGSNPNGYLGTMNNPSAYVAPKF